MVTTTMDSDFDILDDVVSKAHDICNELLLFEAISLDEREVRLVLEKNNVHDPVLQQRYLALVKEYDKTTSRN